MLHLVGYSATNMAVFIAVISFFNATSKEEISDFAGLADTNPFMAVSIAIGLFSLAGLPFFAGFATKFYLFTAAANQGLLWLAGLAIFSSLISLYYYIMVIRQMYMVPPESNEPHPTSPLLTGLLGLAVLGVFFIGIYPAPIVDAAGAASAALFG